MEANGNAGSANYCANATTQPNEIFPEEIQFEQDFEAYEILPEEVQFEQDFVTLDDLNNQAEIIFHEDSSIILPEQDCNKNPNKVSTEDIYKYTYSNTTETFTELVHLIMAI